MLKKVLKLACAGICAALALAGCGDSDSGDAVENGRIAVYSGLPPIDFLTARVGADRIESHCVLPEGRSPHDYSPGPHDIRGAASSRLFFTTGMNFENALVRPLASGKTRIVDVTQGVHRIPFDGAGCTDPAHHHDEPGGGHGHEGDDGLDPHVWLSMENAAVIAANICAALCEADPAHADEYRRNLAALQKELAETDGYVKKELAPWSGREFFVYHPAFGYFARMSGLRQVAVELGGREATPRHLADVIRRARETGVRVVFVQPQFNPTSSRALADALGGEVAGLDPLAHDLTGNVRGMADALKRGFQREAAKQE